MSVCVMLTTPRPRQDGNIKRRSGPRSTVNGHRTPRYASISNAPFTNANKSDLDRKQRDGGHLASTSAIQNVLGMKSMRRIQALCHATNGESNVVRPSSHIRGLPLSSEYDSEIFRLALPALFSVLLDPLMSIVDTAIIGRIGVSELAGTGLAGLIWTIFTVGLFQFLVTATTPLIARANAQQDSDRVSRIICTGLWLAFAISTVVFCLKLIGGRWLLANAFKASGAVLENSMNYLNARIISLPAALMQLVCIGAFRGKGDTRTILFATVIANSLNIVLDLTFIFAFGWGVSGAAASSAVSTVLSFCILVYSLFKSGTVKPKDVYPLPEFRESLPLLSAGLALSLKSIVTMYTVGLASSAIAQLGAMSLAAHEIIKQLFFFCYIAVEPLSVAGQNMVAVALGSEKVEKAKAISYRLVQLSLSFGFGLGLLVFCTGPSVAHFFTKDAEVNTLVRTVLPIVAFFQPFDAVMLAQEGVLLGARQHAYISRSVIITSIICFMTLYITTKTTSYQIANVWACVKILTLGRAFSSSIRLYFSQLSPILDKKALKL